MKKVFTIIFYFVVAVSLNAQFQTDIFQIRVMDTTGVGTNGECGNPDFFGPGDEPQIAVQMRTVSGDVIPTDADQIFDLTFGLRWNNVNIDHLENDSCIFLLDGTTQGKLYNEYLIDELDGDPTMSVVYNSGGFSYQSFSADLGTLFFPAGGWPLNEWQTIAVLEVIVTGSIPPPNNGGNTPPPPQAFATNDGIEVISFNELPIEGDNPIYGPNISINSSNNNYTPTVVSAPMPLNLLTFDAQRHGDRSTFLNWETVDEINTSHFLIERSEDYRSWEGIGTVQAAGESAAELRYEYLDKNVFDGRRPMARYYYRLKMTDLDDKYEYSNIEVVQFQGEPFKTQVYAYPNPANQGLHVAFNIPDEVSTPTNMTLYNRLGQMVYDRELPEGTELEFIDLKRHNIETGAYILQVIDADNTIIDQQKIIVQRN